MEKKDWKKVDFEEHKNILIAGTDSYIGESFRHWLSQFPNYTVNTIDTRKKSWNMMDFSVYDVVYDVAGIAHIRETDENRHLFYEVNRNLAVMLAKKAKKDGVKQFVYLSSMSVYGLTVGRITKNTPVHPTGAYGKSKVGAEKELWKLKSDSFHVSILRPPMVYGYGCKGNYQTLRQFVLKFGFFPDYPNERSMIYIDNLSSAVRGVIHYNRSGVYFPQNGEYVSTCKMAKAVAEFNGKRFKSTKLMNLPIRLAINRVNIIKKVFGTLTYDMSMNVPDEWIVIKSNKESFERTESSWIEDNGYRDILVSITTAAYNSENTIARTIESVLNQSYENIEYIIIDGASSDRTVEIAKSYEERFREKGYRFLLISEQDRGMYDAINKGIRRATGELVGNINSDDWYEKDAVERVVKKYNETQADFLYGDLNLIMRNGTVKVKKARKSKYVTSRYWNHPTQFATRALYLEEPYRVQSMYDDFDLFLRVSRKNYRMDIIHESLANFSMDGMSHKRTVAEAYARFKARYQIYRQNGYSRWYWWECSILEVAKFLIG